MEMRGSQRLQRLILMVGPGLIAAVAYLDPGNFATNISAGAQYGYLLVWVILAANLMALLVQYLAARIGILTGRTLPELIADRSSTPVRIAFWLQAQLVAIATDIAEVVGGAVALQVLTGMPIIAGAIITVVVSTAILVFQGGLHHRRFERLIILMVILIAVAIFWNLALSHPSPSQTFAGLLPRFQGHESLLLAAGMLGATVMPHAIYVHSALVRDHFGQIDESRVDELLRMTKIDVTASMVIAGGVNVAMVLLAAAALRNVEGTDTLTGAHEAIVVHLGQGAGLAFALALLISGLASTTVGSLSGAVVLDGLLRVNVSPLTSRLITAVPAVILLALGVDPTRALVISQVVLSFGIPLVVVPLIALSANVRVTKRRLPWPVLGLTCISAVLIIVLNIALIVATFA